LITFKSSIIIDVKGNSRWWNCSLLLYRAGTNGGQGIDGAVKVFWLESVSSLVAFNMARQVKAVHLFTIVSALELQV
jgi:hypothetical protein